MLNWNTTPEDFRLIVAISDRVMKDNPKYPDDKRTLIMDLQACHMNGCKLDLAGLLSGNPLDFSHDVYGIRRHINRQTGKLEDCFTPRYALPEVDA